ncbi:monocarboxylate transporter 9-like [Sycon ciliatum]|uniref:monocarboxylate transporter 9-like n=1 Tax=Sycon ciliatum TaxID=27933 RepID=UPI0031F6910B
MADGRAETKSASEAGSNVQVGQWRKQSGRALLQLCGAFMLYWVSYGTDLSDGIIYARLILPPCDSSNNTVRQESGTDRSNGTMATSTSWTDMATARLIISPSPLVLNNETNQSVPLQPCGGFGEGASRTAWITSLSSAVRVGLAFMGGVFIDACGVRATVIVSSVLFSLGLVLSSFGTQLYHLYLARGILSGMASGVIFSTPIHCLALSFDNQIALATGIAYTGSGVCAIVYGYLGKEVVSAGDWRWYYRMVAFFGLLCIPAVYLMDMRPPSPDIKSPPDHYAAEGHQETGVKVACSRVLQRLRQGFRDLFESLKKGSVLYHDVNFLLMSGCYFLYAMGYFFPFISSSHRSRALGIQSSDVYLQVAYIGFGTIAGFLLCAANGLLLIMRCTLFQALCLAVMGSSMLLSILVETESSLTAYNIFYSVISGACSAACGPAAREVVSAEMTVHAFGHLYLLSFPAMALGPPIAGWIYDLTQSYTLPLVFGGLVLFLAAAMILIADVRIYRQRNRSATMDKRKHSDGAIALTGRQLLDTWVETSL